MKKAFTLVEILVSVVLLGLISIFVTSTIYQTRKNSKFFEGVVQKTSKIEKFEEVLYRDILQSTQLSIESYKLYSIIYIRSKNTVYNISNPYIVWLVVKNSNTLIRMESSRNIQLPVAKDDHKYIFLDIAHKNCQSFLLELSKNKKSVLIYIKIKNQNPSVFEVLKI